MTDEPAHQPTEEPTTRTFLIADIRGYTIYTREQGDEAAAALASRFAGIVSDVVAGHQGHLVEVRGDEALVVFTSARQALRAALGLQARFGSEDFPRGVGIGLDSGEAIPVGDGYRGTALNLAARLCGQAGPGETLASEAVIHLASTVDGIGYADPRVYHLKGIEQPIRAVHVVPADQGARGPIRYGRENGVDRRIVAAGGLAALAVVVATIGLFALRTPTPPPASPGPSASAAPSGPAALVALEDLPAVLYLDPESGAVRESTTLMSRVGSADFADGAYWLVGTPRGSVDQIDPATHERIRTVTHPVETPRDLLIADGILWVADYSRPRVVGVDIATSAQVKEFTLPIDQSSGVTGLAMAAGSLWVATALDGIHRLDPATGKVQAVLDTGAPVIASDGDMIVVQSFGRLERIDPISNDTRWTTAEITSPGIGTEISFGGGSIWVSDETRGTVTRVERTTGSVDRVFDIGLGAVAGVHLGQTHWTAARDEGRIVGIDAVTGQTREIEVGHFISSLAASGDELLVAVSRSPEEIVAALPGDTLTIATPAFPFIDPDQSGNLSLEARQAGFVTCAGLLRYPDKPAPDGFTLIPEVAKAMPDVSADRRTYTFSIGAGWMFSDGRPLTAETYRYTIERALAPSLASDYAWYHAPDLAGLDAYGEGTADHIEGIAVDGDRIAFTLAAPQGDFLDRISLPVFCPVPIGTPAVPHLDPDPPIPSAGPYYLAEHIPGELALFKRNAHYAGTRSRPFDAIAFREGIDPSLGVSPVETGLYDAVVDGSAAFWGARSVLGYEGSIAATSGPGSEQAANGRQRWFGSPRFATRYLALAPADPLLADADVRRAIALAIDRAALAENFFTVPWASLLPPTVRGAAPGDGPPPGGPPPGPDLEAARALLAGRTGTLDMAVEEGCDRCRASASALAGQLGRIGITVRLEVVDQLWEAAHDPAHPVDIIEQSLDSDYPDPVRMMHFLRDFAFLPDGVITELDRLEGVEGQERVDGAAALAGRIVEDEHLVIPIGYFYYPMFVAEEIGCGFVQPAIAAVDLLTLCRRA